MAAANRDDPARAVELATRAIEVDGTRVEAWRERALAREALGQADAALSDWDAAVRCAPGDGEVLANRGALKVRTRDLAGARVDLDRALELRPDARVHRVRGTLREKDDPEGAIADYEASLRLDPADPMNRETRERIDALRRR
jgi:Tfp pilus assembly protein PilF